MWDWKTEFPVDSELMSNLIEKRLQSNSTTQSNVASCFWVTSAFQNNSDLANVYR